MAFPQRIAGMLRKHPALTDDRTVTEKYSCQGAKFHSPNPLVVHRTTLKKKSIYLCGTCKDNLLLLMELLEAEGGSLEWSVLREFGIRHLLRERTTTDG